MPTLTYHHDDRYPEFEPDRVLSNNILHRSPTHFILAGRGAAGGYQIDFQSISNGFKYNDSGFPDAGIISRVQVKDPGGTVYLTITGPFADASLVDLWAKVTEGDPRGAMRELLSDGTVENGSPGAEQMETYGLDNVLNGHGGNDIFDVYDSDATVRAGAGNDTFIFHTEVFGSHVHGGTGKNTLVSDAKFLSFALAEDHLSGISQFKFGHSHETLYVSSNELPGGAVPHIRISAAGHDHIFGITAPPSGIIPKVWNGGGIVWQTGTAGAEVFWNIAGPGVTKGFDVTGVPNISNLFYLGDGNDHVVGGSRSDVAYLGGGHNFFDGGRGGTDVALFSGDSSDYTFTFVRKSGTWIITDLRSGQPDGTNRLVNVEEAEFLDKTVILGAHGRLHVLHAPLETHQAHFDFHLWA